MAKEIRQIIKDSISINTKKAKKGSLQIFERKTSKNFGFELKKVDFVATVNELLSNESIMNLSP